MKKTSSLLCCSCSKRPNTPQANSLLQFDLPETYPKSIYVDFNLLFRHSREVSAIPYLQLSNMGQRDDILLLLCIVVSCFFVGTCKRDANCILLDIYCITNFIDICCIPQCMPSQLDCSMPRRVRNRYHC